MKKENKYLYLYLAIAFGVCWGVAIAFIFFSKYLVPITGQLTLTNPVTIIALYAPSIAGIITYMVMGGFGALQGLFSKLIPRKQDLVWFPIILVVFIVFALSMHYGSLLFGIKVPKITYTVPQMISIGLWNFIKETGLIGGVFGWIGFLLPFLQGKLKNNITAGLLTGLIFGLWVLPGYIISSFGTTTSYLFYVTQLMAFVLFQSYIFNATKGNLLFYLFAFWLAATGSHIQLYYFIPHVQIMQISFFVIAAAVIRIILKKMKVDQTLQTFPDFIQVNDHSLQAGHTLGAEHGK